MEVHGERIMEPVSRICLIQADQFHSPARRWRRPVAHRARLDHDQCLANGAVYTDERTNITATTCSSREVTRRFRGQAFQATGRPLVAAGCRVLSILHTETPARATDSCCDRGPRPIKASQKTSLPQYFRAFQLRRKLLQKPGKIPLEETINQRCEINNVLHENGYINWIAQRIDRIRLHEPIWCPPNSDVGLTPHPIMV